MRSAVMVAVVILAVILAGPVLAKGTAGKVVAIEGEKVVLQLAEGGGASFPVGTRGLDIKGADGVSLRARVVAANGDKVTFRIMRGKASSLAVGAAVEVDRAMKSGSEEMQGC